MEHMQMAKPESYEVQQVLSREEWEGKDDVMMVTYEILLADSSTKWKSYVPLDKDPGLEDGASVEGWKNDGGKFGIATGSSNGGQRRSKGSSDNFERRPDHPRQEARAIHTSALSATPDYMRLALESNATPTPKNWEEFWTLAETTIAKLEATYTLPDRD